MHRLFQARFPHPGAWLANPAIHIHLRPTRAFRRNRNREIEMRAPAADRHAWPQKAKSPGLWPGLAQNCANLADTAPQLAPCTTPHLFIHNDCGKQKARAGLPAGFGRSFDYGVFIAVFFRVCKLAFPYRRPQFPRRRRIRRPDPVLSHRLRRSWLRLVRV